jgi:predicted nucleic acid-binding protein
MSSLLLDTNILIYLLAGNKQVRDVVSDHEWCISFITEMELQMKPGLTSREIRSIHSLLEQCNIIGLSERIKQNAISVSRNHRLKLADSIIFATALQLNLPLLTADVEFAKADPDGKDAIIISP